MAWLLTIFAGFAVIFISLANFQDWMTGPIALGGIVLSIVSWWALYTGRLPPFRPPFSGGSA